MNGNKILLDTNIIIQLFANDIKIKNYLSEKKGIFVPSIVIGELYYGAFNSIKKEQNIKKINDFTAKASIINIDSKTSEEYGYIKANLKKRGHPIPENDVWIGAIAKQYNLILVTKDKHFNYIDDIEIDFL